MSYDINIVNPIDYQGWDDLLISTTGCTFFHTSAWARVLSETYHYDPVYFTVFDSDRLIGLIPMMKIKSIFTGRRGVSLPFSDYCEPIITEGVQIQDMIDFIKEYGRKCNWKSIEIRGGSYPNMNSKKRFYSHSLKLTSNIEQLHSRFNGSVRRNIKKAIREGVEVNASESLEGIRKYYHLHCITRKRHGLPPQPYSFFKNIHKHVLSTGSGSLLLAFYGKTCIAGSIFFNFGRASLYKFGASDYAYQHLRANDLILWKAISNYAKKKYESFYFGRTSLNNAGLRRFKRSWGTEESIISYYKYYFQQNAFMNQATAVKSLCHSISRIMPIPLLRLLGKVMYKHVG